MPGIENGPGTNLEHPLLWAIVELRETVNRLVEDQKALVLSLPSEASGAVPAPVLAQDAPVSAPAARATTVPPAAGGAEGRRRKSPTPRPAQAAPASVKGEAVVSRPTSLDSITDPPAGKPQDPRQRLDALAKLLDKRLKQTVEPGSRGGDA